MEIAYKPAFLHAFKKLPLNLQAEAREKITIFKNRAHHRQLEVHKLHGKMQGRLSFSVNNKYRVVFRWEEKNLAVLLMIGDHDVYR